MQVTIVKIGGNILDHGENLESFLKDFSAIDTPKILIHGGGKIATELGHRLNIDPNIVDGRRITDKPTLDLVTMVYAGLINKQVVASLQAKGCNAIGLTGADANLILAEKRPVKDIDYGYVGDVKAVNGLLIANLLADGITPVFAPITHDLKGNLLNTNADTMAGEVAKSLINQFEVSLLYCFEKKGVLLDINNENSAINQLEKGEFERLKQQGVISTGMIPKLSNAFAALEHGVNRVIIMHAYNLTKMHVDKEIGTMLKL